MTNEQFKDLATLLEKLTQENPNLFTQEEIEQSLKQDASFKVITNLLETIKQQAIEIEVNKQLLFNYQNQTQDLHSKLIRNKPRRLSLDNGEGASFINVGSPTTTASAMSRRGSGRSPDRGNGLFSPFLSPQTPLSARSLSPIIPEFDEISSLVEERENELTENASEVIAELQTNEDNLRRQVGSLVQKLSQKEDYIKVLEAEKEKQDEQIKDLKEIEVKNTSLQTVLLRQENIIQDLGDELRETNNDFLTVTENNKGLIKETLEARQVRTELEKRLEHAVDKMRRLENSKEQTYSALLTKYNEISQTKQSVEKEKEELTNLIQQKEIDYQLDKEWREQKFQKRMDNLRSFQINGDDTKKTSKARHSHSYSFSSIPLSRSRSNSYDMEVRDDSIVFSSRPTTPLSAELKQKGFAEKGGKISNNLSSSPTDYQGGNIFDISFERSNKRMSAPALKSSPLVPNSSSADTKKEEIDLVALLDIDNILNDIDDLGITCNEEEHLQLKADKDALEASTQKLNEKLLEYEAEKKEWRNELGQVSYELKEAKSNQINMEKALTEAKDKADELATKLIEQKKEENEQLARKNEILQDELEKIRNERDAQRLSFVSLANNVNQLEETNRQLESGDNLERLEAEVDELGNATDKLSELQNQIEIITNRHLLRKQQGK